MSNINVTGQGGKGSAKRKGADDKKFAENYDRIFGKKDGNKEEKK